VKRGFADTHFFIALLNSRDEAHARAMQVEKGPTLHLVTTRWVLAEFADAMASPAHRIRAAMFLKLVKANPRLTVLDQSDALFEQGCDLYAKRPDKEWSLTDCISFAAMVTMGLTEALTGDRSF
jgi:predicted nucleic acid-binding protein